MIVACDKPATRLYYLLHGDTATCMLGARKNAPRDAARLRSPKGSVVNSLPATSTACTGIISTLTSVVNTVTVDV